MIRVSALFAVLCVLAGGAVAIPRAQAASFLLVAAEPAAIVTGFGADIFAVDIHRGNRVNVTHTPFEGEINPASAGNDRDFAFTRMNQDFVLGLMAEICLDGPAKPRTCFPARGRWDSDARWSPDGEWLIYHTPGNEGALTLLLNPRTGATHEIEATTDSLLQAAWSPDGRSLAAVHISAGFSRIVLVDIATGEIRRISPDDDVRHTAPVWNPTGRHIAYLRGNALAMTPLETPGDAVILTPDSVAPTAPAWSPDGSIIAFADALTWNIFVIGADGTGLRRITGEGSPLINNRLTWSPDGRYLAFSTLRGGAGTASTNALQVYDAHADHLFRIPNDGLYFYDPSWW
jgi:dipeptidyl aminopeptidase/acylaminoacyl peptidase